MNQTLSYSKLLYGVFSLQLDTNSTQGRKPSGGMGTMPLAVRKWPYGDFWKNLSWLL